MAQKYKSQYYSENRDKILNKKRDYYQKNRAILMEKTKIYGKKWYKNNKEKIRGRPKRVGLI